MCKCFHDIYNLYICNIGQFEYCAYYSYMYMYIPLFTEWGKIRAVFLYFVKPPLGFSCSYTSTLRVWVKATDPPADAETGCDTDPASTQIIVLNSSSSKSDIALAFSSHGFHTTKIKVSCWGASCFWYFIYSIVQMYQTLSCLKFHF